MYAKLIKLTTIKYTTSYKPQELKQMFAQTSWLSHYYWKTHHRPAVKAYQFIIKNNSFSHQMIPCG